MKGEPILRSVIYSNEVKSSDCITNDYVIDNKFLESNYPDGP